MSQIEETLSLLERSHRTHEEIRKGPAELSLRQKFVALSVSEALAELLPSERRAALDVIKQRDKRAQLDLAWLAGLLKVLKALKAQEK
jgi:phytoene/squalene synthetase